MMENWLDNLDEEFHAMFGPLDYAHGPDFAGHTTQQDYPAVATRSRDANSLTRRDAMLPIVNKYGNVDLTRQTLPEEYAHVSGKQLQQTCRKLKIDFAEAVVGFEGNGRRCRPVRDGVVVSAEDAPKLRAEIEERQKKYHKRRSKQANSTSILSALFTLNRRAKRCRDQAQQYYDANMHGLAGKMRREKESIYALKGQALHHLVEEGRLSHAGYHRFGRGNWGEVLEGEGYRFHRPCPPPEEPSRIIEEIKDIEAQPKGASEPPLDIAKRVVNKYLRKKPQVQVYEWPPADADDWDDEDGISEPA